MTSKLTIDDLLKYLENHVSEEVNELAKVVVEMQLEIRQLHDDLAKLHNLYHDKYER